MAKKKSPNAALIESLKPPKTIPYDPELMQAIAEAADRDWRKFEMLRRKVYRHVMPTIWTEELNAEQAGDTEQVKAIQMRAHRQWRETMGVPDITSFENLKIIMAAVAAAGYPATDAGLLAWTIANKNAPTEYGQNLERDAWLYKQKQHEKKPWSAVLREFKQCRADKGWQSTDLSGIRNAVTRYAEYHNLPRTKGRAGRPKAAK